MPDHDDDQSSAPDLGAAVQLDNAETLDGPAGGADALDAGYVPPDRPFALDDDPHETLDERLAAETPETAADVDATRSGRLTGAGAGEAADVGVDGGAASAEEAAVHDVDADTRVDGEPSVADAPSLVDPEVEASLAAADSGPARRDAARDAADVLDAAPDAGGAAAPASGRTDAGPLTGL